MKSSAPKYPNDGALVSEECRIGNPRAFRFRDDPDVAKAIRFERRLTVFRASTLSIFGTTLPRLPYHR